MIKWLKERQLGNTMDRKTIYEHLGPKFSYTGIIDYGPDEIQDLKWTSEMMFSHAICIEEKDGLE